MFKLKPDSRTPDIFSDPAHLTYSVQFWDNEWCVQVMVPGGKVPFNGEMMSVKIIQERSPLPSWLHPIASRYR